MKIKFVRLFVTLIFISSNALNAQNWSHKPSEIKGFIENKAQFNHLRTGGGEIPKYVYDGGNEDYLLGATGFTLKFREIQFDEIAELREEEQRERGKKKFDKPGEYAEEERKERMERDSKVIRDEVTYEWIGANPNATMLLEEANSYYHSYWYTDASGQATNTSHIPSGKRVVCKDLYPGIDAVYEFHPEGGLKYSLIVHPGGNPAQAQLQSSKKSRLGDNGALLTKTRIGMLTEHAPVCYYTDAPEQIVSSQFSYSNRTTTFNVEHTQLTKTLVIDPWIQSPTFNTNWDCVWECDRDAAGNVYIIGGVMPMQLIKYNSAGAVQWTYSTPYDTTNWMGTMATDLNGNTYITQGTEVAIQKVSTAANVLWNNPNPGALFSLTEFWSISFNCDQTELFIGGTGGVSVPLPFVYRVNAATGAVSSSQQVSYSDPEGNLNIGNVNGWNEVRAFTAGKTGRYYYLTHDTIGVLLQADSLCEGGNVKLSSGCNLAYKCENFRVNNTGIQAMKTNDEFLFVNKGDNLEKRDIQSGVLLDSVSIPGGQIAATLDTITDITFVKVSNSGIDVDSCGNIYVGATTGVYVFNQEMDLLNGFNTSFKVYDVAVTKFGNIIACGSNGDETTNFRTGSVQSFSVGACASQSTTCCQTAICPPPALCLDGEPFQLQALDNNGSWSGFGVNESGEFDPNLTGTGYFTISHQLACGSESVEIVVNNCSPIEVCLDVDSSYTISAGQGPFSWQYLTEQQNIQITTQEQCEACGYSWFFGSCLNGFFPALSCVLSESSFEFATGINIPMPDSFPIRVINSIGIEKIIYSSDEVLPCTNCSDLAVAFAPANTSFCNTVGGVILEGGEPAGGIYSGTAVFDNVFYPSLASNGVHPITYYYSNELGCADSATVVFEVDNCTGTEFIETTLLTIAPNPLHDLTSLTIQSRAEAELYTAELYDLSGRSMLATKIYINDQATLVLPLLARGVYTLILRSEKRTLIKSLVKI